MNKGKEGHQNTRRRGNVDERRRRGGVLIIHEPDRFRQLDFVKRNLCLAIPKGTVDPVTGWTLGGLRVDPG